MNHVRLGINIRATDKNKGKESEWEGRVGILLG